MNSDITYAQNLMDLRGGTNHPLSLRYSEIFTSALLQAEFRHGRAQPGVALDTNSPFVDAALVAIKNGLDHANTPEMMKDCLRHYYNHVQPQHAAEWLGMLPDSESSLKAAPPWGAVFPWRARSQASYQAAYEKAAYEENLVVGKKHGIEQGWLFCGPVSEEKIQIEAERILYVLRRISEEGYQRSNSSDGDVRATALVDENNDWRWLITAGNHRAAAAAALGYSSIPVRVNLVISRQDVDWWKHVVEGLFTRDEALSIFDNFFYARPGAILLPWLHVREGEQ